MTNKLIEQKELKQDGYSIFYYCSGEIQKEVVLFLHPAYADHRCFDKQIAFFSTKYRVITMDMLGHGKSKIENAKDKIDFTIYHIEEILKSEGYSKAHIVSVSVGTLIAQYYALHFPNKVQSLTVLGGYDINANNKDIAKAQRFANVKLIFKAVFAIDAFRKYVSKVSVYNPEEQARFYEMSTLFTRKSFLGMSGLGNVLKLRENIHHYYPLLILCGDKDIDLVKQVSEKWHGQEANSQYFMLQNAGHCANMDKADEFNKIVMDFISKKTPDKSN